jgi:hypothetical protein
VRRCLSTIVEFPSLRLVGIPGEPHNVRPCSNSAKGMGVALILSYIEVYDHYVSFHVHVPYSSPHCAKNLSCVRFEASTMVTRKNAIFWDIKPQFVPHRKHITFLLQSPAS